MNTWRAGRHGAAKQDRKDRLVKDFHADFRISNRIPVQSEKERVASLTETKKERPVRRIRGTIRKKRKMVTPTDVAQTRFPARRNEESNLDSLSVRW